MLEGKAATQHHVNRLEKTADRNHMKPNKDKCRDLRTGQGNSMPQYWLGFTGCKAALQKKSETSWW